MSPPVTEAVAPVPARGCESARWLQEQLTLDGCFYEAPKRGIFTTMASVTDHSAFTAAQRLALAEAALKAKEFDNLAACWFASVLLEGDDVHLRDYERQLVSLCASMGDASLEGALDDKNTAAAADIICAAMTEYRLRHGRTFVIRPPALAAAPIPRPAVPRCPPTSAMDFLRAVRELWQMFHDDPDGVEKLQKVLFLVDAEWTRTRRRPAFAERPIARRNGPAYTQVEAMDAAAFRSIMLDTSDGVPASMHPEAVPSGCASGTSASGSGAAGDSWLALEQLLDDAGAFWRRHSLKKLRALTQAQPAWLASPEDAPISGGQMKRGYAGRTFSGLLKATFCSEPRDATRATSAVCTSCTPAFSDSACAIASSGSEGRPAAGGVANATAVDGFASCKPAAISPQPLHPLPEISAVACVEPAAAHR